MTLKTFKSIYHCLHRDYEIDVTNCLFTRGYNYQKDANFRNYLWKCDVGEVIKL